MFACAPWVWRISHAGEMQADLRGGPASGHVPAGFLIVDLTHPHAPGHRPSLDDRGSPDLRSAGQTRQTN